MRYFITNILPHHLSGKYKVSYAASNFSWALINSTVFDRTFSIAPTNVIGHLEDVEMKELVYSNWREKGKLFQKLAPFKENFAVFKEIKNGSSIWFYNISLLNILLFFLCLWFKPSVQRNVIILDIYIPKRRIALGSLYLWALNHANATVRLSNSARFTCPKSVCLPGVVPQNASSFPTVDELKYDFLLSGLLREDISQISMIIRAFSHIPNVELHITGFSKNDELLRNECNKFENIHFYGELPFDEYLNLLHQTPFLLSTRNPNEEMNQCNFPSKVIEGILHNRIIISTIQYEQLSGLKYFYVSSNDSELKAQISDILKMSPDKLIQYANQSEFAKTMFNPSKWDEIMSELEA